MVDSLTASKLTMESFARNRARLALVGCPGATEWLNVVPATRMGTKMSSAEFLVALKRWVGQPTTAESQQCPQCADHRADEYGDHALQCASGGCKYRRHNDLRDMLYKAAQGVGLQPVLEPSHLCTDEKRPADFLTIEGDAKMCNDIFVIHPFAAAHITATIEEPGSATEKYAENIKHANFKKLHIAESHGFRALGVDTFGGWNAEGRDFISARKE